MATTAETAQSPASIRGESRDFFFSDRANTIRVTQLAIISPFWITYNIFTLSVAGILTECFNLVSIGIYYVRVHREKRSAR